MFCSYYPTHCRRSPNVINVHDNDTHSHIAVCHMDQLGITSVQLPVNVLFGELGTMD